MLDALDKKIIKALHKDVRASFAEIARQVKSSKEVVYHRVNRLQKEGIIQGYVAIFGRGYSSYKILVQLQSATPVVEEKLITYLVNHPDTNWVTSCSGSWDLVFAIKARSPREFAEIFREISATLGNHLQNYAMVISLGSEIYGPTFVSAYVQEGELVKQSESEKIDEKDKAIARVVAPQARIPLSEISRITHIPLDTVAYRLRRMEREKIVRRYRLIIDSSKLGFTRYEVFIHCIPLTDKTIGTFREFTKQNAGVEFFSVCVGHCNIEMTVHYKTADEFRTFVLSLKDKFSDSIKRIETITLFKTKKYSNLPREFRE